MICFNGGHSGEGGEEVTRTGKKFLFFLGAHMLDGEGDCTLRTVD